MHRYSITHVTKRVNIGGTNENLQFPLGESNRLIDRTYNDREQGQADKYCIDGPEICPTQAFRFRMFQITTDHNWRWRCGEVQVEDMATGYSTYVEDLGWVEKFQRIIWMNT
jgi:hypothetical protein